MDFARCHDDLGGFLWLYVGKLGEKLEEQTRDLGSLREEIEALKKDVVDL